jgi:hypothetical protein
MWAEFRASVMALQLMLENGAWMNTDILQPARDTWQIERKTISRATTNREFKVLARGVAHLFGVQVWERQDEAFESRRHGVERAAAACIEARVLAFTLGESSFARWRHRRKLARAAEKGPLHEPDVPDSQAGIPEAKPRR